MEGLLPEHLAGADLTGAKLPDEIAKFPALDQVAAISSEARKIFIGLLAACVYSWLVIGTTTDVALILNTASSPLPIINTPIPIAGFYVVGATLLAAVYCYFHFYLQRLWRTLATLPAVFPDGTALDDRTDPWLLTNLVRADFTRLQREVRRRSPGWKTCSRSSSPGGSCRSRSLLFGRATCRPTIGSAPLGSSSLIGVTALFGRHSYRLARATLRGEAPAAAAEGDDGRGVSWREPGTSCRQLRPGPAHGRSDSPRDPRPCARSARFRDNPRDRSHLGWRRPDLELRRHPDLRRPARGERGRAAGRLGRQGLEQGQAGRPARSQSRLRGRHARVPRQCRPARRESERRRSSSRPSSRAPTSAMPSSRAPTSAVPSSRAPTSAMPSSRAPTSGSPSFRAPTSAGPAPGRRPQRCPAPGRQPQRCPAPGRRPQRRPAPGRRPHDAQLQGADLSEAQLQGADLADAQLQGADLAGAQLQGADLNEAQLQGADLSEAQLQGADLRGTSDLACSGR